MAKLKKLPDDCTFPQLAVVFDAARFATRLEGALALPEQPGLEVRGVKMRRLYYKPGRSCRLIFDAKIRGSDGRRAEQTYFGKIYPEPKPASAYRRARAGRLVDPAFGPAVALLPDLGLVLWAYPNDPNLPGLATLASRDAVAALVTADPTRYGLPPGALVDLRHSVGKYVPGQRCGYRYRIRWAGRDGETEHRLYGKAYQKGLGRPAWDVLAQLAASNACRSGRLRVPHPYAFDAENEIVWQEMLPGQSFAKARSLAEMADWAGPVAASLGAFHATPLALGDGLGLEAELEELAHSTRKIAAAYPQHAARCRALEARLVAAVPCLPAVPRGPVHGSFKVSHVFDAGGQVAFIDFDGAGLGDPTYDVGRFLAHLAAEGVDDPGAAAHRARATERFREAYAAAVPWGWPEARVRWYTSALLLSSQAYKCVKRMAPERVGALLDAAEQWFPAR